MVELLVAILIALGSLTSPDQFNDEFKSIHQSDVSKAQNLLDTQQYYINEKTGGVVVADGTGV